MCTKLSLAFASLLLALCLVVMAAVLSSSASARGTTELAPANGEVTGPRDLFDMDELKRLTLDDLQWTATSERILPSGVTETIGSWSGGVWHTFDITGTARTITLSEQAAICWPPGYPHTPNSQAGFGYVFAVHEATRLLDIADVGEQLALAFGIPVLYHGEEAVDWESLGYGSRGDLVDATVLNLFRVNRYALVDLTRGNFGWASPYTVTIPRRDASPVRFLWRLPENSCPISPPNWCGVYLPLVMRHYTPTTPIPTPTPTSRPSAPAPAPTPRPTSGATWTTSSSRPRR